VEAYLIETSITLVAVCALALVVLWGARRLGVGRPTGPIELCGHLPLDARRSIYLVRVGAQVFIVGVGEGGFTKLGELDVSQVPETAATRAVPFAEVLGRALKGRQKT
jgi:flagellar protein FliO/FliZ